MIVSLQSFDLHATLPLQKALVILSVGDRDPRPDCIRTLPDALEFVSAV